MALGACMPHTIALVFRLSAAVRVGLKSLRNERLVDV